MERKNNVGTYVIKISDTKDSTWQGTITWVNRNRSEYFRSALELLKMIDCGAEDVEYGY